MKKAISFLLSAALLLGLTACGAVTPSPTATPESTPAETRLSDFSQPPELRVLCGKHEVMAEITTYSWTCRNADGSTKRVEADGVHPLQMLDEEGRIYLTPLPVPEGEAVKLAFAITPDEFAVRCWPEEMAYAWFEDHAQFSANVEKAAELTVTEGCIIPPGEGGFIYEVAAKWTDGAGNGGTAYYGFYTTDPVRPENGEDRDPDLAFLKELSDYTTADWEELKKSGEVQDRLDRLMDAAFGADQAQRNACVMTVALRTGDISAGVLYTTFLSYILLDQREADPEAWSEAISAFSREEADQIRLMTDFAAETQTGAIVSAPFWFSEVRREDLSSVSLHGLTADDLAEEDVFTDGDWERVLKFIRRLNPV